MSRRIEIELTSRRDDGAYTWRAAGAREPRGVIEAATAGEGAKVGDVLRVEIEVELDGMRIVAVLPQKAKSVAAGRIEILAPKVPAPGVTTSLVEKKGGRGARSFDDRDRAGGRPGGDRERTGGRGRSDRPEFLKRDGTPARPPRESGGDRRRNEGGPARPPRPEGAGDTAAREGRPPRASAPARGRTRPPRLIEGTANRDALFATLPAEQRPIAEQLALGGLPAVRRALAEEQTSAKAAGRPPVAEDGIVAIAEQLLGSVREAVWLDRADAAVKAIDTISLRDLRAAVAGAAPRDDAGRELLRQLRDAHDARVNKLRTTWSEEIQHALTEGRVLQALRISSRLPEPSARFPAELVTRLAEAASAALSAETPAERWIALLEAASASPVRRIIKPAGLPGDDAASVRQAASAAAGRIPALAALLGLPMPPPPGPPGAKAPAPRRPARPRPAGGGTRIPPPPTGTTLPEPTAPAVAGTEREVVPDGDAPTSSDPVVDTAPVAPAEAADAIDTPVEPTNDDAPVAVADDAPAASDEATAVEEPATAEAPAVVDESVADEVVLVEPAEEPVGEIEDPQVS